MKNILNINHMVIIYRHWNYIEALEDLFQERKNRVGKWTLARMGEEIGIQPSYITNVLKGRAHLQPDQLYTIAEHLGLKANEREYLLLLLDYNRSTNPNRKADLKDKLFQFQKKYLKSDLHISAKTVDVEERFSEYYLNPICPIIHVFLNFDQYAKQPEKIAQQLGIAKNLLGDAIAVLEKLKYIEKTSKGYKVLIKNRHLPKDSPLCEPHQTLMRYKSIDQMQRIPKDDKYSFSVTLSCTPQDKNLIHQEFLNFLKKSEHIVKNSKREEIYQINFDLFPWSLDV